MDLLDALFILHPEQYLRMGDLPLSIQWNFLWLLTELPDELVLSMFVENNLLQHFSASQKDY